MSETSVGCIDQPAPPEMVTIKAGNLCITGQYYDLEIGRAQRGKRRLRLILTVDCSREALDALKFILTHPGEGDFIIRDESPSLQEPVSWRNQDDD